MNDLVGIDIGSGRCKAALVGSDGRLKRLAVRPMPLRQGAGGEATYDPAMLVAVAIEAVREVVGDTGAGVAGVGVASMAESGVPLGRDNEPLAGIIAWFDPRGTDEAAGLTGSQAELYATTGLVADRKQSLPRLIWLRRHASEVLDRMHRWAGVADLVALRLGGGLATHPSLAGRTLAYDLPQAHWSSERLAMAGVRPDQMPPVREVTEPAGALTPESAAATGIRSGVPVVVAGHDHVVGAFAVGATRRGIAADSMGTAEAACLSGAPPPFDDRLRTSGFTAGRHVAPDEWYVLGGLSTSGGMLDWLASVVGPQRLDAALEEPVELPTDIVMLPYLRGRAAPEPDRDRGALIAGLRARHGLSELAAAALEGASLHVRWMLQRMSEVTGQPLDEVRLYGGGTRRARWLDLKGAIDPWPSVVMEAEAVAVGAALTAGVAGGVFGSPNEAAGHAVSSRTLVRDEAMGRAYDVLYRDRFLPLARGAATGTT